jgi:hypothetical protein
MKPWYNVFVQGLLTWSFLDGGITVSGCLKTALNPSTHRTIVYVNTSGTALRVAAF